MTRRERLVLAGGRFGDEWRLFVCETAFWHDRCFICIGSGCLIGSRLASLEDFPPRKLQFV